MLNKNSLAETVDNLNEAFFYGNKISKAKANELINWIRTRFGTEYSYNGSFGITNRDLNSKIYTFTGERLSSLASMRHIMAEETSRVLIQLSKIAKRKIPELEKSNKNLLEGIKKAESEGKHIGTYCCGPCTVGLWRHMSVGGFGSYSKNLPKGLEVLKSFRDGKGKWGRFPFYYTLLALSEINHRATKREIEYAKPLIERLLYRMNKNGRYSKRRYDLLQRFFKN
ncbi:MAG: hypothetical protein L0Y79_10565 [Chlorobi bacterium]|nr:hypothetical protein [Chlorobiota bacterium]MCI0715687.1 hypothetical protein [Chlorobiota bacterium]